MMSKTLVEYLDGANLFSLIENKDTTLMSEGFTSVRMNNLLVTLYGQRKMAKSIVGLGQEDVAQLIIDLKIDEWIELVAIAKAKLEGANEKMVEESSINTQKHNTVNTVDEDETVAMNASEYVDSAKNQNTLTGESESDVLGSKTISKYNLKSIDNTLNTVDNRNIAKRIVSDIAKILTLSVY